MDTRYKTYQSHRFLTPDRVSNPVRGYAEVPKRLEISAPHAAKRSGVSGGNVIRKVLKERCKYKMQHIIVGHSFRIYW
ncbi:hypothetical protein Barb4_02750 [Bacteroidales bacterium Barb4]|nr:hypothetical protein Barb4_02750 [Bacteroidales bacterium Barb4]